MKSASLHNLWSPLAAAALLFTPFAAQLQAQQQATKVKTRTGADGDVSLRLEIEHAIDRGLKYLATQQDLESGAWSEVEYPALTALPVAAFLGDPSRDPDQSLSPALVKGLDFIASKAKRGGGIYGKGLATYNTSLSMMALLQAGDEKYLDAVRSGRRFLINQQQDFDVKGVTDSEFDGGVGYGGSYAHSDLSNTHLALEALYYSKKVLAETGKPAAENEQSFELDWDAAIEFVSLCQNTEETAKKLDFAAVTDENRGGFVYFPGDSKAGEDEINNGEKVALRSYGSMSYAGLLSFIYAEMSPDDPRVKAVMDWLGRNFSLEENPGLSSQGLYYYYHTMAKALSAANVDEFKLADGSEVNWRQDLAVKLFDLQQEDGSWINEGSSRWWESDRVLVTAYAVLALEHIHRGL
jgi:squalene-hopene/tetraprenyl-beta-curcumene cyclase